MAATSMDVATWLRKQVAEADTDLLRDMVQVFAEQLMSAEVDALCGAAYGERSDERPNSRNGYQDRTWDTRAGTMTLAIPKLRTGSYFPDWLLEPRRRAERALVAVVAECYVRGVPGRTVSVGRRGAGVQLGSPEPWLAGIGDSRRGLGMVAMRGNQTVITRAPAAAWAPKTRRTMYRASMRGLLADSKPSPH